MNELQFNVIDAICYSRLVNHVLSPEDCILLHQYAHQNKSISVELMQKFKNIRYTITTTKWKKPEFKYNEQFDLFYRYEGDAEWTKVSTN